MEGSTRFAEVSSLLGDLLCSAICGNIATRTERRDIVVPERSRMTMTGQNSVLQRYSYFAARRPARSASSSAPLSCDSSQNIAPASFCAAMYSPFRRHKRGKF